MAILKGPELVKVINLYVEEYSKERNLLPNVVRGKREFFSRFLKYLGDQEFNLETSREYLCTFLVKKNWQAISRANEQKRIRAFTSYLFKRKIIIENWGLELESITVREKIRNLPGLADAVRAIIAGTEPSQVGRRGDNSINRIRKADARAGLLFIVDTGLRISELKSITSDKVFLKDEYPYLIIKQKFGDEVPIDIPIQHTQAIKDRIGGEFVFNVTEETMNRSLKRGTAKLGLPKITCHDLRRIFGRNLDVNGASLFQIKDSMRHKDISITQKYIQYGRNQVRIINQTFHDRNRDSLPIQNLVDFAIDNLKRIIGDRLKIETNQKNNEWNIKLKL